MTRGIYCIRNSVTGDCYVGQSHDIARRWGGHKEALIRGNHHSYRLQRAWNVFGTEAFTWEVVEEVPEANDLYEAEARHIQSLQATYNSANVYARPNPFPRSDDWYLRRPEEHETATITRTKSSCPCCGMAVDIEVRHYPGLGRIVEVTQPNIKTGTWETVATHVFREDGTEVTDWGEGIGERISLPASRQHLVPDVSMDE